MSYAIVYSSRTGNTRMLAEALRAALPPQACVYFGPPDGAALAAPSFVCHRARLGKGIARENESGEEEEPCKSGMKPMTTSG